MRNHKTNIQPCAEQSTPTELQSANLFHHVDDFDFKPGSFWVESLVTKDFPIVKGGKYLVEPFQLHNLDELRSQKGIFLIKAAGKFITLDKAENINLDKYGVFEIYKYTGHCNVPKVEVFKCTRYQMDVE